MVASSKFHAPLLPKDATVEPVTTEPEPVATPEPEPEPEPEVTEPAESVQDSEPIAVEETVE